MSKIVLSLLLISLFFYSICFYAAENTLPSFNDWYERCMRIPIIIDYKNIQDLFDRDSKEPEENRYTDLYKKDIFRQMCADAHVATWQEINTILTTYLDQCKHSKSLHVIGLHVPAETKLFFIGDRHGDARSTMKILNHLQTLGVLQHDFLINDQNTYIIFLGDYVNRGASGIETIITALLLKNKNPQQVFLIRGNHEDETRGFTRGYFFQECHQKFAELSNKSTAALFFENIRRFFHSLPLAVFVGVENNNTINYLCACHAFPSLDYNPKMLFSHLQMADIGIIHYEYINLSRIQIANPRAMQLLKESKSVLRYLQPNFPSNSFKDCGFAHHQLIIDDENTMAIESRDGHWLQIGKPLADALLQDWTVELSSGKFAAVRWIIRGHQHVTALQYARFPHIADLLQKYKGCTSIWNEQHTLDHTFYLPEQGYYTLNVAPNNEYGPSSAQALKNCTAQDTYPGLSYDTLVCITTGHSHHDWWAQRVNIDNK